VLVADPSSAEVNLYFGALSPSVTIPLAAQSQTFFCARSLAGIVSSNPAGDMDICLLWVSCVVR